MRDSETTELVENRSQKLCELIAHSLEQQDPAYDLKVFDYFLGSLLHINEYAQILLCHFDQSKQTFNAIRTLTNNSTQQIQSPIVIARYDPQSPAQPLDLVITELLKETLDFSVIGWSKPIEIEFIPLKYDNQIIGCIIADVHLVKYSKDKRLENIHLLLRNFIPFLAKRKNPALLEAKSIMPIEYRDDIQVEAFIHSPVPIAICDELFHIKAFNEAAEAFFSVQSEAIEGRIIYDVIPEIRTLTRPQLTNVSPNSGEKYSSDVQITLSNGKRKVAKINLRRLIWHNKNYWWITLIDLTDLRTFESLNERQENRLQIISDVVPTGILQVDEQWEVQYANEMWCELTGIRKEELRGQKWLHFIPHDRIEGFIKDMRLAIRRNTTYENKIETHLEDEDQPRWLNVKAKGLPKNDGIIICLEDITKHELQTQKLVTTALTDNLTGLTNRNYFFDRLNQACLKASRGEGFALLSVDLDNFKWINDSLGHDVGDIALKKVANHLQSKIRHVDSVSRIGGDEFMILLSHCSDPHQVSRISQSILDIGPELDNFKHELSLSIGIALVEGGQSIEPNHLLKQADLALYSAKNSGKRQANFYSAELSKEVEEKLALTYELRRALSRKEMQVYFQPVWNSERQKFIGAEALLRWNKGQKQLIEPEKFIDILESDGRIEQTTWYVLDEALYCLRSWIDNGLMPHDAHMAVNFSSRLFRLSDIDKKVERLLRKYQLHGSSLIIEITETTILNDEEQANTAFKKLRRLGIKIALDDFGTGYSPLSYLTSLSIDIIKIDKSFVLNYDSMQNQVIIRSILSLAKDLNLQVVAEGVESELIYQALVERGCQYFQGFLFAKPTSFTGNNQLLKEANTRHECRT